MSKWKLEQWCVHASQGVRYLPDRKQVYKELRQHVDDRYESFIARGETEEEAVEHTLHAMGDAREVSKLMGQIHRPFWGYLYSVTKWVAIAMACACLLYLPYSLDHVYDYQPQSHGVLIWGVERENPIMYTEPGTSVACDGYSITLTDVTLYRTDMGFGTREELVFHLKLANRNPWAKMPDIMDWICAEDSNGNYYYSYGEYLDYYQMDEFRQRRLYGIARKRDLFTTVYEMHLGYRIPDGTQWIDLHYNRDGRDWKIRIDLTGGNSQ